MPSCWSVGARLILNSGRMVWMLILGMSCFAVRMLGTVESTVWVGQSADGSVVWTKDEVQYPIHIQGAIPYLALGLAIPLNSADAPTLTSISGIGRVKSEAIVSYRSLHGCFGEVADLKKVSGIGPKTVLKVAPYLRIDGFVEGACASPPDG